MSTSLDRCPECGAARTGVNPAGGKYCPNCGKEYPPGRTFCINCAMRLPTEPPQPMYPSPAPVQQPATAQQTPPQYQQQPVPPAYDLPPPPDFESQPQANVIASVGTRPVQYQQSPPPHYQQNFPSSPSKPPIPKKRKVGIIVFAVVVVLIMLLAAGGYNFLTSLGGRDGGGGGGGGGGDGGDGGDTATLSAPTNVSASAGNSQVTISWTAVTNATSYNIYWSTTSGVTKTGGTKITGATSPYVHTGLTNDTTYYYIVTAANSLGESAASAEASATPTAIGGEVWPSEGIIFSSRRDGYWGIWVMNIDGSNPRRLSSVSSIYYGDGWSSSSPDGSKIVFSRSGVGIIMMDEAGEKIIKGINSYDQGAYFTTWSYDGKIYFTGYDDIGKHDYIYSINEDGTGEAQVTPVYNSQAEPNDLHPSVSPDGLNLVFFTNRVDYPGMGFSGIAKMAIGSDSFILLVDEDGLLGPIIISQDPTWSPDGSKIAFAGFPNIIHRPIENSQIYVMNADGSGKVQLTFETEANLSSPSWSPDGTKIVFVKEHGEFGSGDTDIWIMNADGSGQKALTDWNVTPGDSEPCFIGKPI